MIARYIGVLVGVWYVTAPFVWGYDLAFNWWHSMVIGGAVLALSAAYLVGWSRVASWLMVAVGAYSMASPFLYGYLPHAQPFFNDLVFGVIVVALGAALGAATIEVRRLAASGRPSWREP
jgi:hypothetical protein